MSQIIQKVKSFFNLFNPNKQEGLKLAKDEKVILNIPEHLVDNGPWSITKWYKMDGESVMIGDKICKIESKHEESIFESFMEGKIKHRNTSNTPLSKESIIVEIIGI